MTEDKIQASSHSMGSTDGSRKSRRSSFFQRMGKSFVRSSGERGAGVETLRGERGADFEGYAIVQRGAGVGTGCGCFGSGVSNDERLLLVKGPFCFVFHNENDKAPKYAISLAHLKAAKRTPAQKRFCVSLQTNLGEVEYDMIFEREEIADEFHDAVKKQAAVGETNEVKKRLGHEHLLTKRSSLRFAESVAMKKINDCPEKNDAAYETPVDGIGVMAGGPGM